MRSTIFVCATVLEKIRKVNSQLNGNNANSCISHPATNIRKYFPWWDSALVNVIAVYGFLKKWKSPRHTTVVRLQTNTIFISFIEATNQVLHKQLTECTIWKLRMEKIQRRRSTYRTDTARWQTLWIDMSNGNTMHSHLVKCMHKRYMVCAKEGEGKADRDSERVMLHYLCKWKTTDAKSQWLDAIPLHWMQYILTKHTTNVCTLADSRYTTHIDCMRKTFHFVNGYALLSVTFQW